ncbi:hypothetical protein [Ramlibacter sp.]|uniref:hypothetical protein n=1 Tax=Ramlibacter sp. TaxID=1917967 RepID=UPI003D11B8A5
MTHVTAAQAAALRFHRALEGQAPRNADLLAEAATVDLLTFATSASAAVMQAPADQLATRILSNLGFTSEALGTGVYSSLAHTLAGFFDTYAHERGVVILNLVNAACNLDPGLMPAYGTASSRLKSSLASDLAQLGGGQGAQASAYPDPSPPYRWDDEETDIMLFEALFGPGRTASAESPASDIAAVHAPVGVVGVAEIPQAAILLS